MFKDIWLGRYEGSMQEGAAAFLSREYVEFERQGEECIVYRWGKVGYPPTRTQPLTDKDALAKLAVITENGFTKPEINTSKKAELVGWFNAA